MARNNSNNQQANNDQQVNNIDERFQSFLQEVGAGTTVFISIEQEKWLEELKQLKDHLNRKLYRMAISNQEIMENCLTKEEQQKKANEMVKVSLEKFFSQFPELDLSNPVINYPILKSVVKMMSGEEGLPSQVFPRYIEITQEGKINRGQINNNIAQSQSPTATKKYNLNSRYNNVEREVL